MADAQWTRVELRDPIANYHKYTVDEVAAAYPDIGVRTYLGACGQENLRNIIIRQPEFFQVFHGMLKERPIDDWKTYLRWQLVRDAAPYLHAAAEDEAFNFYGKILREQRSLLNRHGMTSCHRKPQLPSWL